MLLCEVSLSLLPAVIMFRSLLHHEHKEFIIVEDAYQELESVLLANFSMADERVA